MHPVVGHVWGEPVPSYLVFLVFAYAIAVWICVRWARRSGVDPDVIIDLGLLSVITGVIGARLMHVLVDGYFWDYVHLCTDPSQVLWKVTERQCATYRGVWDRAAAGCRPAYRDCLAWAAFWRGGLTLYGGFLLAFPACVWLARKERIPVLRTADVASAAILVGVAVGRVGCFFAGCCFGHVADVPWAVSFPGGSPASESQFRMHLLASSMSPSLAVHPTQLYEVLGCVVLAAMAFSMSRRFHREGSLLMFSAMGYAALRFFLEFFRADDRGGFAGLSTSQWLGVGVMIGFGGWSAGRARCARRAAYRHT
jgi:phosphatidylglycerol:prolipoprotein diacylglycerol transferase